MLKFFQSLIKLQVSSFSYIANHLIFAEISQVKFFNFQKYFTYFANAQNLF